MPIYKLELLKEIQGGIVKAYGYETLFKVQAVEVIPRLRKYSSDEKNHQSKQNPSNFTRKLFSEILDEACEKDKQKDIHVLTSGYTKNALPYYNFINMREYC